MKKMKRILSFIMACVIFISSANTGVYATEIDEPLAMTEETVELIENQQDIPSVIEYDDLLEMEAVEIDPNEIEGEVYDADELVAFAENMPALMSASYNLYWDNYDCYYIYNHLSEDEQKLWDALEVLCASYLVDETDLTTGYTEYVTIETAEPITKEQLLGFANMFRYSHPQYYYLRSGYSYYAGEKSVMLAFMVYDAFRDGADRKDATNAVKAELDAWCEQIALGSTEEEKIKIIHDIICDNVDYNHGVLEGDNQISSAEEEIYFTQSAYSVFCTDLTVCAGYTQTFMWLCNAFDISCFGVTSPGHAWNKVKVNDNWYNIDVTWDDGAGIGNRSYNNYLKNDAYMESIGSHEEEEEWIPYLPPCTLDSGSDYWEVGTLPVITQKAATPTIAVVEESTGYAVTIESATDGAKIFYTIDGKTPSEANAKSKLYTGTFRINKTGTIQAIAVCDGYLDSEIANGESIEEKEYIVDSGSCGTNVIWEYDSKNILTISGSGEMESYASANAVPWYAYSKNIQGIEIEEGVNSIGDYAFSSAEKVQSIELPVGITKIGAYAFYKSNLIEIEIPASVTELGEYAFSKCDDMEYVKICGNPTTIGENAFEYCDSLVEVVLSDTYTKIGTRMFFGCSGLERIELPESLTEIGQQALSFCSKLEEIKIPAKVVMQSYAFYASEGLKKVIIEEGVTTISYGAFNACTALEEIRIPKSVTSIGNIAIDATATIYGYAGSAAETYANKNGNTFVDISEKEYKVQFVTGTDEQIASVICQKNSLITEPVLDNRTGYTFDGWYTSNTIQDETTKWDFLTDVVTQDMTLYAKWIPSIYEISEELKGYSLTLEGTIGVNFYMQLGEDVLADSENGAYMNFTLERKDSKEYIEVPVNKARYDEDKSCYVFKCGVPVKDMDTEIKAQIILSDGRKGSVYSCTVREYIEDIKTDEEYKSQQKLLALVEKMSSLGNYATAYFADGTIEETDEMKAVTSVVLENYQPIFSADNGGIYCGSSLLLKSDTNLRHYFTKEVTVAETGYKVGKKANLWYVESEGILAHELGTTKTVHVTIMDDNKEITITYNPLSYAYITLSRDDVDEALRSLMRAMYLYYQAALDYKETTTT